MRSHLLVRAVRATLTVMPASTPGLTIGREFVIERPLGAGGMGSVFVALQRSTGIRRALKLMHPEIVRDPRLRERFTQEARVSGSIPSDHVVQVITAGIDEDTSIPFLVMELLEGEELSTGVRRRGRFDTKDFVAVFEQLCHAIGAAHRTGIVHRDLKPENVFLAQSRGVGTPFVVKVLDFGIAKIVAEARARTTEAMGTPLWMAPEQTARGSSVSPQTDVWALGLIAFFCLTGHSYWASAEEEHPSMERILRQMLVDELASPVERAAGIGLALPSWFDAWFARCVCRDPAARFSDATVAWDELALCLRGQQLTSITEPMLSSPVHDAHARGVPATLPWAVARERDQSRSVVAARDHVASDDQLLSPPRDDTTSLTAASNRKGSARKPVPWILAAVAAFAVGLTTLAILAPSSSNTASRKNGQLVSPTSGINSDSKPDSDTIESRVTAWNAAHASKDDLAFASLYADSVLYYGSQQSRDGCVSSKRVFLSKNPDFRQEVVGQVRAEQHGDDARADFLKRVLLKGKLIDYPSYLIFKRFSTGWKIVTEGDTVTDANLAKRASTPTVAPPDGIPTHLFRDDALAISAKSKFGRFEMVIDRTPIASSRDPLCRVAFHRPSGTVTPLFVADLCGGKYPRSDQVGATEQIGEVRFPAVDKEGHEIHLLEIATARGGNAIDASDYWVVALTATDAWVSSMFTAKLASAWLLRVTPSTLMLEEPATTTGAGVRYSASFGSLQKIDLPMLPSSVVSKGRRVLNGELRGGFHYTNWRPLIDSDGESLVIDEDGNCSLPEPGETRGRVRLTAEVSKWSDGRVVIRCLGINPEIL